MGGIPLEYGLYMAEREGYLDTHESKIQNLLKDVEKRVYKGGENLTINAAYLAQFGLTSSDITERDQRRINNAAIGIRY